MTTRAEEWTVQRHWQRKPEFASLGVFDQLLENEFLSPKDQQAWQARALSAVVGFAAVNSPYYARLFGRLGLTAEAISEPKDLAQIPFLTKQDLLEHYETLQSRTLPAGEGLSGTTTSSGTTGRPVTVLHSHSSRAMSSFLRQRHSRWHRLDPMRSRLDVRARRDVAPLQGDGSPNADGIVLRFAAWRGLGQFFETGPEYAFNVSNPMERQVQWLRELRPHYVMSYPTVFEEWLLANEGQAPVDSIEVLVGVGAQLSPSMRRRLEESYRRPVHQGYGLNEIGVVACRCEAGRYHTHSEHCLVEIVDEAGRPCLPGQIGHVLVTGLRNLAMPLIRYDTGDMAEAVADPCPCGRTLPSFGEIAGRFRRYAGLPAGTKERFRAILRLFEEYPPQEMAFLRRYQVHQDKNNQFTLRLRTAGPIPEKFGQAVAQAWGPVAGTPPVPLAIVEVEEIVASPSGKRLDFVSDFYDDAVARPGPAPAVAPGVCDGSPKA